jgi:hypothetical protein
MKTLDINYFNRKISKSIKRFPWAILFIVLAFVSGMLDYYTSTIAWRHLFLTSLLAIPIFVSINLYLERVETRPIFNFFINLIGFVILIIFFLSLPHGYIYQKHYIRAVVLFIAFLVSMFYLPFVGFNQQLPFWFYSYGFVKRIIVSLFYTILFFSSISFIILSVSYLFNINLYFLLQPLAYFFFVLFFPWMIVAGLYTKFDFHADKKYYPQHLLIISKYVLMPLLIVFGSIIFIYLITNLINSIFSSVYYEIFTIIYSLILILVVLMIYPVFNDEENRWLKKLVLFSLFFSFFLFIFYLISVFVRISDLGLTEFRLFAIIYAFWFVFVASYLFIRKFDDLRVIPFTLLIILLLSVSGPLNVFKVSKKSQLNRLINIAKKENIFTNGKINARNKIIKLNSEIELSSVVYYLAKMHGYNSIIKLFNVDSLSIEGSNTLENVDKLLKTAGLRLNLSNIYAGFSREFKVTNKNLIKKLDKAKYFALFNIDTVNLIQNYSIDTVSFKFNFDKENNLLRLIVNDKEDAVLVLNPLYEYLNSLSENNKNSSKSNDITLIAEGEYYDYVFYLFKVKFDFNNAEFPRVESMNGIVIIYPAKSANVN